MKKEHVVGLIVVALLVAGGLWWRGKRAQQKSTVPPAEGEGIVIEDRASQLAKRFGVVLPENVERTDLKDVSGGAGSGIATRSFTNGEFELTVMAALSDPEKGSWYEAWLVRDELFDMVYAGKLRLAKGGFLAEFKSPVDLKDHRKVVVTLERKDDRKPEVHVLEGDFK